MKLLFFVLFLALPVAHALESKTPCTHTAESFNCVKVLRNYDADTITVEIPDVHPLIGKNISVRVRGIDAPEIKGKNLCEKTAARTAKRLVENLLKNAKRVDLVNVDRDKYFRVLADVMVDGQSIKAVLIKNHLAYEYDGGTKRKINWCAVKSPLSESTPQPNKTTSE